MSAGTTTPDLPRVGIGFHQPNALSGLRDRRRLFVALPSLPWERAEKLVAILAEHGAREEWGVMVAPVSRCEAIGKALSRAGFEVVVDADVLAAGRAAAARGELGNEDDVQRQLTVAEVEECARGYLRALQKERHPDFARDPVAALGQVATDLKTALTLHEKKEDPRV